MKKYDDSVSARVIQVIETISVRGGGTEKDLMRPVRQYWSLDGKLLADDDEVLRDRGKTEQ